MCLENIDVLKEGYAPVLRRISKALLTSYNELGVAGFESSEQFGLAARLFGTRAVSTLIALLRQMGGGFDELNEKVVNSAGVMKDTVDVQLEGLKPFYRLQAAIDLLKVSIAESGVLDAFAEFADDLADLFNRLSDADNGTKRLAFNLVLLFATAGPLIFVAGLLITQVANIGRAFLAVGSLVSFILTPLGLVTTCLLYTSPSP